MRDFAAREFLSRRPEARALYARAGLGEGPRLSVRAAADGRPAEILLYDEIGFWGVSAQDFVRALAEAGSGPLVVRINSPGGDAFDGLAIYNALRQRGGVEVVIDGVAASAASYVALAGARVRIQESAMMMVHNAWTLAVGDRHELLQTATVLEKLDGQMAGIYAAFTGRDLAAVSAWMDAETWFTSAEALEAGLVHEVLAPPPSSAAAPAALARRRAALRLRLADAAA